jgi:hypothetical protein
MKLSFAERLGLKKPKTELQTDKMPIDLRNSLWSVVSESFLSLPNGQDYMNNGRLSELANFYRDLWLHFFKLPIDELSVYNGSIDTDTKYGYIRKKFFSAEWYEVYEFIEFVSDHSDNGIPFRIVCNEYLKRELSAYRFVDNVLVEINSEEELREIENAINQSDKFQSVRLHLKTALNNLSKKNSDYRNSVKESISAVESCCNILLESNQLTLGQALKKIEDQFHIPRGIKNGFSSIYGYASHEDGIRHGLNKDAKEIGVEEARFMLIASSAFINYLLSKSQN